MDQRQAELYFLGAIYKSNGTDLFFKIKINYIQILVYITQVEIRGRFRQESTRNRWNVEAVLPPEIFPIFSNDLRPVPAEKHRKLTGIHRKKSNKFPVRVLLPLPPISGAFLQDPVAVIFDLEFYHFFCVTFDLGAEARRNSSTIGNSIKIHIDQIKK
jgi:hypothetical protein